MLKIALGAFDQSKHFLDPGESFFYAIALKRKYDLNSSEFKQASKIKRRNLIRAWRNEISTTTQKDLISKCPVFRPLVYDDLPKIEKQFRCRIYLWGKRSQRAKYECVRKSPYMRTSAYDNFIDLILTDIEIESLIDVSVIFDIDEISPDQRKKQNPQTYTLFEAIAIEKNPELDGSITRLRQKVKSFENEWGKSEFHIADAIEFYKKFKINIQIWNINQKPGCRNFIREKIFDRRGMPKVIGVFSILILNY